MVIEKSKDIQSVEQAKCWFFICDQRSYHDSVLTHCSSEFYSRKEDEQCSSVGCQPLEYSRASIAEVHERIGTTLRTAVDMPKG